MSVSSPGSFSEPQSGHPALEASRRPAPPRPTVAGPSHQILRSHPTSGPAREPSGPPFRTFPEPTSHPTGWAGATASHLGPQCPRLIPQLRLQQQPGFCVAKAEHALQSLSSPPGERPEPRRPAPAGSPSPQPPTGSLPSAHGLSASRGCQPRNLLPQGLCICCSFCLETSSPDTHWLCPHFPQVLAQVSSDPRGLS